MSRITNNAGLHLGIAVWVAHDDYDYNSDPMSISATSLIQAPRQLILSKRVPLEERIPDLLERVASRVGQALHGDVERAWTLHYVKSLERLGYPKKVVESIRVNPTKQEPDTIPVYTEVRAEKTVLGIKVSGKFDLVIDGQLIDVKKTSVFKYQKGVGETWMLQGSIYRWLNPEKITHADLTIQYILLDWNRGNSKRDPKYPPHELPTLTVELMGLQETEQWVTSRLELLLQLKDAPDADLPECTDEELWRSDPVYKYFSDPNAEPGKRSTKNFETLNEAMMFKAEKGKGRVDKVPGQVKACLYCAALPICLQAKRLIATGDLVL